MSSTDCNLWSHSLRGPTIVSENLVGYQLVIQVDLLRTVYKFLSHSALILQALPI